jgi:ribosome biogenesis GTPase A
MQEVQLDKLVKLLDCPGVVFDDSDGSAVLLKNCVDVESMPDPAPAVEAVLQRCQPEQLMQVNLLIETYINTCMLSAFLYSFKQQSIYLSKPCRCCA